jgi:hypothetical protein
MIGTRNPREISELMAAQARAGFGFRNPIYRALLAGDVFVVVELMPGARIPREVLWRNAPTIIVAGDDAGRSNGPGDFPDADKLMNWARHVMIHATGGEAAHYQLAADAARENGRVLLIETRTTHEVAWEEMALQELERRDKQGARPLMVLLVQVPDHLPAHPTIPDTQADGGRAHG